MRAVVVSEVAEANGLRMTEKRTARMREMAIAIMSRFYKEYRQDMSPQVKQVREDLIVAIMKGESAGDAFERLAGITTDGTSMFGQVRLGVGRKSAREVEIRKEARKARRKEKEMAAAGKADVGVPA